MRRRVEVVAIALAVLVLLPAARAQHELDAQRETTEAEARAARRDLMRQFAEESEYFHSPTDRNVGRA